jgi:hypothetical protein
MIGIWRQRSRAAIAQAVRDLPSDATLPALREALRAAYPFGERKHFPYTVWLDEVGFYLGLRFPEVREQRAQRKQSRRERRSGLSPLPDPLALQLFGKQEPGR